MAAQVQLIGRKKCRETQKAQRWLKERGFEVHFLDLDQKALSPGELESVARSVGGFENLVDVEGSEYRKLGYAYLEFDARTELLERPALLKTPVLRRAPKAIVGFDEKTFAAFVQGLK